MEENKFRLFKRQNTVSIIALLYIVLFSISLFCLDDYSYKFNTIHRYTNLYSVLAIVCMFIVSCVIPLAIGISFKTDGTYIYSLFSLIFFVAVIATPLIMVIKGSYISPFNYIYLIICTALGYNLVIFISSFMVRMG